MEDREAVSHPAVTNVHLDQVHPIGQVAGIDRAMAWVILLHNYSPGAVKDPQHREN